MGAFLSNTCAPYLSDSPSFGSACGWNESSAVALPILCWEREPIGRRPQRLAAAITENTELCLHLSEKRLGELKMCLLALEQPYDYGTLGFFAGKIAHDKVPVFKGIGPRCSWTG